MFVKQCLFAFAQPPASKWDCFYFQEGCPSLFEGNWCREVPRWVKTDPEWWWDIHGVLVGYRVPTSAQAGGPEGQQQRPAEPSSCLVAVSLIVGWYCFINPCGAIPYSIPSVLSHLNLRKEKFVESAARFRARHGGKSRLDEINTDYSNIEA